MASLISKSGNFLIFSVLIAAIFILSSCSPNPEGEGGESGNVSGLEMATTMSVVTPTGTGIISSAPLGTGKFIPQVIADTSGIPADADYFLDPVSTYVWDESMESMNTVNMILCIVGQARVGDMVNTGPYIALINMEKCEQGQGQTDAGGATGVEYQKWIVESVRAFSNSPQYVNIWWPKFDDNDFTDGALLAQAVISSAVSNDNPFGGFEFNFKLINKLAPADPPYFKGSMRTVTRSDGNPQFTFVLEAGDAFNQADGYHIESANALLGDVAGTTGVAKTFVWDSSFDVPLGTLVTQQDTYLLAFDANNLYRRKLESDGGTPVPTNTCMDRTAFDTQVWSYNIYDASTGARTELNGSFSFTYLGEYGNVGYNGLWYNGATLIPDGVTLDRDLPGGGTTPVDLHISDGLLQRKTANTETVANLVGQRMYYWGNTPDPALALLPSPADNGFDAWAVDVDDTVVASENHFVVTGGINFTNSGAQFTASTTGSTPLQRMLTTTPLFFWSDALAGWVSFIDPGAIANSAWTVTYYTEEKIMPSDSAFTGSTINLKCYDRCPIGGLTQPVIDVFTNYNNLFYLSDANPKYYTATATTDGKVVLTDDTAAAPVSIVGLDITALGSGDRLDSGPMVESSIIVGGTLPYSIYDEPVSYSWRTSDNYWDRLITVTPSGSSTVIVFDKPIRFDYTHEAVNELNASNIGSPYIGSKMVLEYDGPGNLYGFPYSQVPGTDRWESPVVLNDAVLLTDLATNTYITKGVQREQTMQGVAIGVCAVLDPTLADADALGLPRGSDITPVAITLADKPIVTAPPAVIDGELQ